MRVGISFVSVQNAEANLRAEDSEDGQFEKVRTAAHDAWTKALSAITIEGGTKEEQTVFYTALYHALLQMNVASDT